MNIRSAVIMMMLTIHTSLAFSQQSMISHVQTLTDQQIWDGLSHIDSVGSTIFGQCKVADTSNTCPQCACRFYFRASIPGIYGNMGWPKNPISGDGTGCLNGCWNGYSPDMCSSDIKVSAKAMLLDALNKNACGSSPALSSLSGSVTIFDSSRFHFVEPTATCAKGKVLCGVTGIGPDVGGIPQFTPVPETICRAAYVTAQKLKKKQINMITCNDLTSKMAQTYNIYQAAPVVGQLNESYSLFNLSGMNKFLDSSEKQYQEMATSDVALFYVAAQKDISKLPEAIKSRIDPSKFETNRDAGDKFIVSVEINSAEMQIQVLNQNIINGKNLDLPQAMLHLKK